MLSPILDRGRDTQGRLAQLTQSSSQLASADPGGARGATDGGGSGRDHRIGTTCARGEVAIRRDRGRCIAFVVPVRDAREVMMRLRSSRRGGMENADHPCQKLGVSLAADAEAACLPDIEPFLRRCSASSAAPSAVWPGSSPDAISTTAAESSAFFCSSPSPLLMTMRLALDLRSHAVGFLCCFLLLLGKLQSRLRQRIRHRLHLFLSHRAMSVFSEERRNELKSALPLLDEHFHTASSSGINAADTAEASAGTPAAKSEAEAGDGYPPRLPRYRTQLVRSAAPSLGRRLHFTSV